LSERSETRRSTTSSTDSTRRSGSGDATSTTTADSAAAAGLRTRFVKIIAVAAVKPNGKYDIVDVEIHPWKPGQTDVVAGGSSPAGGQKAAARPSRPRQRRMLGCATSKQASGAAVASGSRAGGIGSSQDRAKAVVAQLGSTQQNVVEAASNVTQNNNVDDDDVRQDGLRLAISMCT